MTNRRAFLAASAAGLSALAAHGAADNPHAKVRIGMLGARIRGKQLLRSFTSLPQVEIAAICDPDLNLIPAALKAVAGQKRAPRVEQDLRKVIADPDIDAIVVAAPDHWHALATVWACQAGKHVYVEKPCSHTIIEGRRMVEAARKHKRIVQVGTQRRSAAHIAEARDYVRAGKLGKVPFARAWIAGHRKSIGKKKDGPVPAKVDYDLWTGPAPLRPFNPNRFHYEWHWNWAYGTGEIGNNGIHGLDVCRWLLDLDGPKRIASGGGIFFYDDDRQTPDTHTVAFDFPNCQVVWEHRIWAKTGLRNQGFGVELIGEKGTLVIDGKGWHIEGGEEKSVKGTASEKPHIANFLSCIASGKRPNADIEEGHRSTRLCHLGNIAHRLGRTLHFDAAKETFPGDKEAVAMLGREYRKNYELPTIA